MRLGRRSLHLLVGLALPFVAACGASDPPEANVVLVLVDQLRKDAADRWMPAISKLAAEGVRFENVRSAAPWTYPSVVSMFSGLNPQQHGADGHPRGGTLLATFDEGVPLLPRRLRAAGFHTAGFMTNPFFQRWNPFHEAFEHYEVDAFIGTQGPLRGFPGAVWRPERMFANSVNREVLAHYDARPLTQPEFTYVHYIDVHGPWDGAPFADAAFVASSEQEQYATATRYVDGKIHELYEFFLERYDGRLVFMVTSDHGRELGDDLDIGEGRTTRKRKASVHDFNTRIPLLILPSKLVTSAAVVEMPCSNVDVAPTLLDSVGLEPATGIPGRSLLPAIQGDDRGLADRPVYAVMSAFNSRSDCVVVDGKKLMRIFDPASGKVVGRLVFDIDADPREERPREEAFGAAGRRLAEAAGTGGIEYPRRFEAPDEETLERLRDLGYLGEDQ